MTIFGFYNCPVILNTEQIPPMNQDPVYRDNMEICADLEYFGCDCPSGDGREIDTEICHMNNLSMSGYRRNGDGYGCPLPERLKCQIFK